MKSISRGCCEPDAVTRTMLSPQRMTTDPPACLAHLPVSIVISLPPTTAVSRTNAMNVSFVRIASQDGGSCGLTPLSNASLRGALRNDQTTANLGVPATLPSCYRALYYTRGSKSQALRNT